jgi:hypothetical protein
VRLRGDSERMNRNSAVQVLAFHVSPLSEVNHEPGEDRLARLPPSRARLHFAPPIIPPAAAGCNPHF